jgi:shikimate kinase/3-dehydroquinate synthase
VVTDLAGFVAGTWLRGVRWVSCPTTLLGMVDAGIGGKTAIDFGAAKNNVGVFHQPISVCINVARTKTEPRRSFVSGLAEVVKSALVGDAQLLAWLERDAEALLARDLSALRRVVRASAAVKASIVSRDEGESGLRAVLNLGHTLGHALEASSGFGRWLHGEAVSLGLVAALRVGARIGVTPKQLPARIEALLSRLDLPIALQRADVEAALPFLSLDKKRGGSDLRFVFVEEPGRAAFEKIPLVDLSRSFLSAADLASVRRVRVCTEFWREASGPIHFD